MVVVTSPVAECNMFTCGADVWEVIANFPVDCPAPKFEKTKSFDGDSVRFAISQLKHKEITFRTYPLTWENVVDSANGKLQT